MMTIRIVLGSLLTVVALAVAGRRVWWLIRLIRSGQPANDRLDNPGAAPRPRSSRSSASAGCSSGRCRAWPTPSPSGASSSWA